MLMSYSPCTRFRYRVEYTPLTHRNSTRFRSDSNSAEAGRNPATARRAEIVGENLRKGSRVYLEGRKRTESWDDEQTGAKHYNDIVYADRIEFLDSKGGGNGQREPAESAFDETTVTNQEIPF